MASVTYGHGFLHDCDSSSGLTADPSPTLTASSLTVVPTGQGDYFKITGNAAAADQKTYYEYDIPAAEHFSTTTSPKFLARYKTSTTSTGLQAKIELIFTSGTQVILDSTFSTDALWVVMDPATITSGKTVDKIRFYAVSDAACSGEYVLYDFALICEGVFTFPNIGYGFTFAPSPRDAIIPIFGRDGDITQPGGTESALVTASCDLDVSDNWKRSGDVRKGQVFYQIAANRGSEAFQWLDTGFEQFKATMEAPQFRRERVGDNKVSHILDLAFREYRLSNASNDYESYLERWGLNL